MRLPEALDPRSLVRVASRAGIAIPVWGRRSPLLPAEDQPIETMETRAAAHPVDLVESYRQLAGVYHDLLGHQPLDRLFERIGSSIEQLVPCSSLLIAEVDHQAQQLVPLLARGDWPEDMMERRIALDTTMIGWAAANAKPALVNDPRHDPRAGHVRGTPDGEPEAIISVPFVATGMVLGAMSLYREGEGRAFSETEFELAQRFADAATLALVSARARAELHQLAHTDDLTGLYNRRGFFAAATTALRGRSREPLALLLIDLDAFKAVNDVHGHAVGDALLQHCARQIASVADDATIGRLGGDEFALLIPGDAAAAQTLAIRLRGALEQTPLLVGSGAIALAASTGVAAADAETTLDDLIATADANMYHHKRTRGEYGRRLRATS
jgi:diguanylate cyclase (GGDEF)-like protein